VNPGAAEIFGNGTDDDCNPGTPDTVTIDELTCTVTTDKIAYGGHGGSIIPDPPVAVFGVEVLVHYSVERW
jgi:hypothetical protein